MWKWTILSIYWKTRNDWQRLYKRALRNMDVRFSCAGSGGSVTKIEKMAYLQAEEIVHLSNLSTGYDVRLERNTYDNGGINVNINNEEFIDDVINNLEKYYQCE